MEKVRWGLILLGGIVMIGGSFGDSAVTGGGSFSPGQGVSVLIGIALMLFGFPKMLRRLFVWITVLAFVLVTAWGWTQGYY